MDLSTLNTEQLAAVRHTEGPLLLLAGAGSGKTRVITYRIAYLLGKGIPADNILAVTFTNKAAKEMRERVDELVGKTRAKGMTISTFHSLCVRILKEDIERLGYKKNFSIYAAADQLSIIRELIQSVETGEKKYDADRIQYLISDAKNRLIPPGELPVRHGDDYEILAAEIYPRYQKRLKACNAVDFDDLLMLAVRLLRENADLVEKYRERFRYVMVDEYQDTNAAQYTLLRLLCDGHGNLCVVGDDDQSIYAWRGADLGNILGFEDDFPGTRTIKLEQNYRSTGNILAAANAVIRHNSKRKEKTLWSAGGDGRPIEYIRCDDEEDEARTVMERIHAERFRNNLAYRDFAILYRTNVQSRAFEEQLRYESIPYVLIGGQQFFDRKEVKDAVAYLKVLVNNRDEVNLLRILNYPRRGIGDTTADRLIRISAERQVPLWDVLCDPETVAETGEKAVAPVSGFVDLLERHWKRFFRCRDLAATARDFFKEVGLEDEIYRSVKEKKEKRSGNDRNELKKAHQRVENLEEVISAMASYQEREAVPTLEGFLEKVSLLDDDHGDRNDKEKKLAADAVNLMSLHSSKGLEFPVVFLVGMEEDFLPHKNSGTDVDEERRLCYVGITRARQHLLLLNALQRRKYGKMEERFPSRFLEEIPPNLLEQTQSEERPPVTEEEQDKMANDFFAKMRTMLEE